MWLIKDISLNNLGNINLVEGLIRNGSNVNNAGNYDFTLLSIAVIKGIN